MQIVRYILSFVIALGISAGFYARLYRPSPPSLQMKNLDYTFQSKEYNDIIYIGSSRVLRQINPMVIDSITGKKSYAIGIDQIGMIEAKMLLKKHLQNHPKPQYVLLNIDLSSFMFNTKSKGPYNVDEYFQYLKDTLIYNELSRYNWRYRYYKAARWLYAFYPLQKLMIKNDTEKRDLFIQPNATDFPDESHLLKRGYWANTGTWNDVAEQELQRVNTIKADHTPITPEGIQLLDDFCQICQQQQVKCILLFTPWYAGIKKSDNHDDILQQVAQIAQKHQALFWNYSGIPISQDKTYFYDCWHYNDKGARLHSEKLGGDFKKLFPIIH
jgi:hypothetical protein